MRREAARLAEENGSLQRALLAAAEAAQAAEQERASQVRALERRSQGLQAKAARAAAATAALEEERDALKERVRELLGMGRHCSQGERARHSLPHGHLMMYTAAAQEAHSPALSCRGPQLGWTAQRSRWPGSQPAPPLVGGALVACRKYIRLVLVALHGPPGPPAEPKPSPVAAAQGAAAPPALSLLQVAEGRVRSLEEECRQKGEEIGELRGLLQDAEVRSGSGAARRCPLRAACVCVCIPLHNWRLRPAAAGH